MRAAQQRAHVVVNVGNVLELAGAAVGCYGVAVLAGVGWALVAAGLLLVAAAELVYDSHGLRIPVPRRPRPVSAVRSAAGRCAGMLAVGAGVLCRRHRSTAARLVRTDDLDSVRP